MSFAFETIVPMAGLALLAVVLPWVILRLLPDTLRALALALVVSALVLWVAGAVLFAGLYTLEGAPADRLAAAPGAAVRHFLGLGLRAALIWLPLLALAGIALGQGIEARRSRDAAARDRKPTG